MITTRGRASQQRGAALVLAIAIAGVAAIAWQQRASLSQLLMAQHVLTRAASAAALAAAQHHARLLNAHAFLNRTVMAHQVAMAHLLTIASAEKMRREMSIRLTRFNPPIYLIGMMFGPHHAAAYGASKLSVAGSTLSGVNELHAAFSRHDQMMATDLKHARKNLLQSVDRDTAAIVSAVIERNISAKAGRSPDVQIRLDLPKRSLDVELIEPRHAVWRDWFGKTIDQHAYLKKRSDTAINWWVVDPKCPHLRHNLRRRGDSTFDVDGLWQATDSLSFHAVRGLKVVLCYWREYPMGFANIKSGSRGLPGRGAIAGQQANGADYPDDFREITFFRWFTSQFALTAMFHGFANVLADGWGYKTRLHWRTRNRVEPYVLKDRPKLKTTVSVKQPLKSLGDPLLRLGFRVKGLIATGSDWGEGLGALASAEAYYDRYEPRKDKREESANLFQPFWMARNVMAK